MGRFIERRTLRLDLDEGDFVEIRTRLTFGDRRALEEILLGNRTRVDDPAALHHADANIETLRRSIVAWGGPGFCELSAHPHDGECRPRPLTKENIEQLDETGERILVEIRNRQVTESRFLGSTPSTSTSTSSRPDSAPSTRAEATASSPSDSTASSSASATAGRGTS